LTEAFLPEQKTRRIAASIYYPDVLFIRINPSRGWEAIIDTILPKDFSLVTRNGVIGRDEDLRKEFDKFFPLTNVIFSIFDSSEIPLLEPHERFLRSEKLAIRIMTYSDPLTLQRDLAMKFPGLNFANIAIRNYTSYHIDYSK